MQAGHAEHEDEDQGFQGKLRGSHASILYRYMFWLVFRSISKNSFIFYSFSFFLETNASPSSDDPLEGAR